MKKGASLISSDLQGKTRGAIPFVKRGIGVTVAEKEVNVGGGLGSELEKWNLVVAGT